MAGPSDSPSSVSRHGMWSSRLLFILAAAGSAVGLGNIWKFPYITGENGGGAFVVVYLLCVALVGVPIMMAEVLLGRAGRQSPINSMRKLIINAGASPLWVLIGWMGAIAGFLILSYYTVIAGIVLYYGTVMAQGEFIGADAEAVGGVLTSLLASPWKLLFWHSLFMGITIFIVARGVVQGLETAIRWFMPALFLLLLVLLLYGINSGGFAQGFRFMFHFNWSALSADAVLVAMGQAFFTLSLGMGAIMAYGAYMPAKSSIGGSVLSIAALDTVIAMVAGLAIFPIVFANDLPTAQSFGLMFNTIPLAFANMPMGALFGTLFFLLVSFAAITSAISLTEPALAYLVEKYNASRARVAVSIGVGCWLLGVGTVLSFNHWAEWHLVGKLTFFDSVDYLSQNLMLPLGGLLIALFAGWALPNALLREELGDAPWVRLFFLPMVRFVAPLAVIIVFITTIVKSAA